MNERLIQAVFPLTIGVGGGLVGVFLAWFNFRKERYRPKWLVTSVRLSVVPWLVLVPFGPLIVLFLFRVTRPDALEPSTA